MFIGHFAVALAAKRVVPKTSVGMLIAAALLPDVVWPALVLLGVEKVVIEPGNTAVTPLNFVSYPWSHSLLLVVLTGGAVGAAYVWRTKYRAGGVMVSLLALSHWVLDWFTHRPDLPLYPGDSPLLGLGLWHSVAATMLVEGGMFVAGVWLYAGFTQAADRTGRYAFWSLIGFLVVIYFGNIFGEPPPNATAIGLVGLVATPLLFAWAAWADRHRSSRNIR
jgi:hypothetical protein